MVKEYGCAVARRGSLDFARSLAVSVCCGNLRDKNRVKCLCCPGLFTVFCAVFDSTRLDVVVDIGEDQQQPQQLSSGFKPRGGVARKSFLILRKIAF